MHGFRRKLLTVLEQVNSVTNLCFTALSDSTITLTNNGGNAPIVYISTNTKSFSIWNYSTITLNAGQKLYMYGDNTSGFSSSADKYSTFTITGSVTVSGDVQSLISQEISDTIPCDYCFYRLFYKCTAISVPPSLSATILTPYCYTDMFRDCNALLTMPELPALTVYSNSYSSMFYGCISIVTACESLPATTLDEYCYQSMFYGCTALETPPSLPATKLKSNCYKNMFRECSNIKTAPLLPALSLKTNCYINMFYNCTSLNFVKALFTTIITDETSYTTNWLYGVADTGLFYKNADAAWEYTGPNGVPENWEITMHGGLVNTTHDFTITADDMLAEDDTTTIYYIYTTYNTYEDGYEETLNESGKTTSESLGINDSTESRELEVSLTMYGMTATTTVNQKAKGAAISWVESNCSDLTADDIGSEDTSTMLHYIQTIITHYTDDTSKSVTNKVDVEYSEGITKNTTNSEKYYGVNYSVDGKYIGYVSFKQAARDVFYFTCWLADSTICINQTGTPTNEKVIKYSTDGSTWETYEMGTTLSFGSAGAKIYFMSEDTYGMSESNSITKTFKMSGMVLACGNIMALLNYSNTVPANCFYKLFKGCDALRQAPSMPSKIMASNCYREMFSGCTYLSSVELPAVDLMDKCYASMFNDCKYLSSIKAMFTTTPKEGGPTDKWVNGVSSSGTFTKNSKAEWDDVFDIYGIPAGWTVTTADS